MKKHLNQSKPHPPLPNSLSPAFTFKTERPTDYSLKKLSTPRVNEIWTQSDIAKGLPIGYHYFLTLKFAGPEIDSCTPSSTPTLPHIHTCIPSALLHSGLPLIIKGTPKAQKKWPHKRDALWCWGQNGKSYYHWS